MDDSTPRTAIFISHATPEDNAFVRWLGAKLTALGYEVWADLFALRGGSDWARILEGALRERTLKMLLICTDKGLQKSGVRAEIEVASDVGKKLNDPEFIIPLRLEPFQPHIRTVQLQYIDFERGWASGFAELSELLLTNKAIPRSAPQASTMDQWLADHTFGSARLIERSERLVSNWLRFSSMPQTIYYCEPPSGFNLDRFQERTVDGWPIVPFRGGALTFARPNATGELRATVPARVQDQMSLKDFRRDGWPTLAIDRYEAGRIFSDLGNQAFDLYMHQRGMSAVLDARGRRSWWADIRLAPKGKVSFNWGAIHGLRQIMGQSEKRNVFWHYAINAQMRDFPRAHLRLSSRLLFSTNGLDILEDSKKAHRLRRSFAKGWRNARWRDMLLAYLWWVSGGENKIALPVSGENFLVATLPPFAFNAPFGVPETGDGEPDEDDPDIEYDYWDEEESSDGD